MPDVRKLLAAALVICTLLPSVSLAQQGESQRAPGERPNMPSVGEVLEAVDRAAINENEQKDWSTPVKLAVVFAGLAILPSLMVMVTSFTRVVIVLSFVRRALATQSIPPTIAIIGLALFLTMFTMSPTLIRINEVSLQPYLNDEVTFQQACTTGSEQFKEFMLKQTRKTDLDLFVDLSRIEPPESMEAVPGYVVVPAFAISEFRTAFEMGCLLFIPFVLVDLVVAGILLSAGMMMLPPVMISLPLKIILFVLVDGWHLLTRTLVTSFH